MSELVANGRTRELERVPGIGKSLADTITRFIRLAPARRHRHLTRKAATARSGGLGGLGGVEGQLREVIF